MRRSAPVLIVSILAACATATVAVKPDFDFARVRRVAVVGFSDYARRPGSGGVMSGAFEQALLAAGYDVIERSQLEKLLQERRLSPLDPKAAREAGRLLGADALLMGQITDLIEPRETVVQADVVDEHLDPVYARRRRRVQENGVWTDVQEDVVEGYKRTRVVRREPRAMTVDGRLGASARLVYVPTGEVLWSGSDVERASSFEDSARSLAESIIKAVKPTWPARK